PIFAQHRTVIAVEEQGHGRTTDRDAPVRFDTSADDVAALLDHLKVPRADLFGFSNGASVAMQVALRHPGKVRKLVYASSMTRKDGVPAEFWQSMQKVDFADMPQPLKDAFLKVNPDPQKTADHVPQGRRAHAAVRGRARYSSPLDQGANADPERRPRPGEARARGGIEQADPGSAAGHPAGSARRVPGRGAGVSAGQPRARMHRRLGRGISGRVLASAGSARNARCHPTASGWRWP